MAGPLKERDVAGATYNCSDRYNRSQAGNDKEKGNGHEHRTPRGVDRGGHRLRPRARPDRAEPAARSPPIWAPATGCCSTTSGPRTSWWPRCCGRPTSGPPPTSGRWSPPPTCTRAVHDLWARDADPAARPVQPALRRGRSPRVCSARSRTRPWCARPTTTGPRRWSTTWCAPGYAGRWPGAPSSIIDAAFMGFQLDLPLDVGTRERKSRGGGPGRAVAALAVIGTPECAGRGRVCHGLLLDRGSPTPRTASDVDRQAGPMGARSPGAWRGRHAVITGGSSGIGLAVAHRLAGRGATVSLIARGRAAAGCGRGGASGLGRRRPDRRGRRRGPEGGDAGRCTSSRPTRAPATRSSPAPAWPGRVTSSSSTTRCSAR